MTKRNPKNLFTGKFHVQLRREQLGWTQKDLAELTELSFNTIQKTEQGLMPKLPTAILDALYSTPVAKTDADLDYDADKVEVRRANSKHLLELVEHPVLWDGSWLSLRGAVCDSAVGFCKLYCIHPQALMNFEKPHLIGTRDKLSPYLRDVFISSGIGFEAVDKIEARMYNWVNSRFGRLL